MAVIDADAPANAKASTTASTQEILAALVGFDTTSRNSNLPLIEWVEAYLARYGVESERVYDATGEKANLWATIGPADAAGIVLSGHTDVVPVDGQDWSTDPFTLTERDGKLYGRGSADMKGFLAACLAKVPAMVEAPLEKPIHLAFSYDEEVGCQGVLTLVAALKEKPLHYEACIVGEPTSMGVVTAHKTTRRYRADFTGLACHSSLAPQGVSAVSYAARLVAYIDETAARLAAGAQDGLYDLPHSTANVGIFTGGNALNIVPASASVDFEYRMLPQVDLQPEHDALTEFVAGLNDEMAARDPSCGVTLEMIISVPGLDTPPDAPVVTFAKRLAGRNDHAKVAFGTEAGSFAGDLGIPTVVLGPGAIAQAHKADEFIAISQLASCERVLDQIIDHCCKG